VFRKLGSHARWLAGATYRQARRIVVMVVGGTVLLAGLIMIFTPGPAVVVIPLGLSILAIEFVWARRWLKRLKDGGAAMARSVGVGGKGAKAAEESTEEPPGESGEESAAEPAADAPPPRAREGG
jgi:hypothetical protein